MKIEYTKYGLKRDPVGAQISFPYLGRILLGDVVGSYREPMTGSIRLRVRHFNGEPWPIDPVAAVVDVLERRPAPCSPLDVGPL